MCVRICVGHEAVLGAGLSLLPTSFETESLLTTSAVLTGQLALSILSSPSQYGVLSLCRHRMFSESCCSNHPVSLPISKNAASSSIFFLLPILIRHSWNHFHQGHPRFCWLNLVPPLFLLFFLCVLGMEPELVHVGQSSAMQLPPECVNTASWVTFLLIGAVLLRGMGTAWKPWRVGTAMPEPEENHGALAQRKLRDVTYKGRSTSSENPQWGI